MHVRFLVSSALVVCSLTAAASAQEKSAQEKKEQAQDDGNGPLAGHSYHGETFNAGPRQKAYLMEGTGNVHFAVSSDNELVQQFINQGVGQLHGFWYLEAERSFRQAAALEPECAIAYWGAAMANLGNEKRAKGFIAEAVKRKDKADEREKMYIDLIDAYLKQTDKKKRTEAYTKSLETIALKYPDDLEAKAFLALHLYKNRNSSTSYIATDALMQEIFKVEPMHPAHHFRIHLWDYKKPEIAVSSAALCGQTSPSIAHMWHMPGHIFSRLKRYDDAAWQQEASARVDHAHMMRDRVMPDQIHNFAHNNEWLIRNLIHVGRVRDALDLAKNMISLPRHPKYNSLTRGSSSYGRRRLFEALQTFEMWEELIALSNTPYLEPTDNANEQIKRLRALGEAYYRIDQIENGGAQLALLTKRLETEKAAQDKAVADAEAKVRAGEKPQPKKEEPQADEPQAVDADEPPAPEPVEEEPDPKDLKKKIDKAKADARKPFATKIRNIEKAINSLKGHAAVAAGDFVGGYELLKKAGAEKAYLAHIQWLAGEEDAAEKALHDNVTSNKNEVQPLAMLIDQLWRAEKKDEARKAFDQLREISGPIDLRSPVFERLAPAAEEFGWPMDWRVKKPLADDIGQRPDLDSLGPFRWQPSPAPEWQLRDATGKTRSSKEFQGQPVVVIFYLGYGCLHCAEQLQAFGPKVEEFKKAGIEMIAISTDDEEGLRTSVDNYEGGPMPIPLVANEEMDVFKAFRAYDDFEDQPLHGTFLIDKDGLVRWQDISYEPFMDHAFVLKEAKRLLAQ